MTIEDALAGACHVLGLKDVQLIKVDGLRIYLFSPDPKFYKHMLRLEVRLHELLNRPVDLRLESAEDKNKRVERTGR